MGAILLILFMLVIGCVALMIVGTRLAESRQAQWNRSMRDSYLYTPPTVFVPGKPIEMVSVPVPDETSTETYVSRIKARKERQRAHAAEKAAERAELYAAAEAVRRAEMDEVIRQAYASLGKEEGWQGWTN